MKMIKLTIVAFSLLFVGHLFAAESQKYVELEYQTKSTNKASAKSTKKTAKKKAEQAVAVNSPACQVTINNVADKRQNIYTLGTNGAEPLLPAGLDAWLMAVKEKELVAKTHTWSGTKQVNVIPSMTKLYAYAENMNIHGVMSLSVDYVVDGKITTKKYRGMGSKANMMNGYGEYATALNYAVHELSPRIIADIKSFCADN